MLRRKEVEEQGKVAGTGTPGEQGLDSVEGQDPKRRREEKFVEKEVAEQRR